MRDPRVDPMPGDKLRKITRTAAYTRWVSSRHGNTLNWLTPDGLKGNNVLIVSWRKWAKTAEVIHVAGEKGEAE